MQGKEFEARIVSEARRSLMQVALELEAASTGARKAAETLPTDRDAAWASVQLMYSRLQEANHLVERLQKAINEAVESRS